MNTITGCKPFIKKELLEHLRNHYILIIPAVFLLLGIMNPLTAKLMPTLLENFMPDGVVLQLSEPAAIDSWMQFYKNVPQMGLIVFVILYSGIMSREYSANTLIIPLTRGLPRASIVISKFLTIAVSWTLAFFLCFGVSAAYTAYYWDSDGLSHLMFAAICLWMFGIMLAGLMVLGGVIFSHVYGNLLFIGGLVGAMLLFNIWPKAYKYNPLSLTSENMNIINGQLQPSEMLIPALIGLAVTAVSFVAALLLFNKKML
ncbi:MAG: ABC transporter permease [Clostridiales bacterium]|nr:ABC transporter permease [Clostridiales bacterium]